MFVPSDSFLRPVMADSGTEPAAAPQLPIERSKEEPSLPAESVSKELLVTAATERSGAEAPSSNGAADTPLPAKVPDEEEEEATPTPPESSSLSSEFGTVTAVTTEEESLSAGRERGTSSTSSLSTLT